MEVCSSGGSPIMSTQALNTQQTPCIQQQLSHVVQREWAQDRCRSHQSLVLPATDKLRRKSSLLLHERRSTCAHAHTLNRSDGKPSQDSDKDYDTS
ncbi:hypothetical protein E2C01_027239 [Portunus trituberculatus]|uniref:Uncharacterized protein n=1 Tax=Portunus trituberculatus TaxID=210409 RepID=A0A5B7ELE9_PORTR|nr:hypothetical protein [Portunus trituberculatus]